jgi:Tol biopolymer transport system component
MPKSKSRNQDNPLKLRGAKGSKLITAVVLALSLIAATATLAQQGFFSPASRKVDSGGAQVSPAALTPATPSKEYVYAGSRLVATEEPSFIAFSSDRTGTNQIYTFNTNGSITTQLTFTGSNSCPSFSPDGAKIAFVRGSDIWVMNADGSGQTNITNNGSAALVPPSWSPNGARIVYVNGGGGLYTMNANGTNQQRIPNTTRLDSNPSWSPDGTKVAYDQRGGLTGRTVYHICVINVDGSAQTFLTSVAAFNQYPAWSPDGTTILFQSNRDDAKSFEIYKMNANGTNQVRITVNADNDAWARWSRDGANITFMSDRDTNQEIYTMNANGTNQVRVTNNPASDTLPSWR